MADDINVKALSKLGRQLAGLAIEMCTPSAQTGRIDFNVTGYVAP